MRLAPSFTASAGAHVFVPRQFALNMSTRINQFDQSERNVGTYFDALDDLVDRLKDSTKRDIRDDTVNTYRAFMKSSEEAIMFLAYCVKNAPFLPVAAKILDKKGEAGMASRLLELSDTEYLQDRIVHFASFIMEGSGMAGSLLSRDTLRALKQDDTIDVTFIGALNDDLAAFEDWVEKGFMKAYSLPLNQFERTPSLERRIKDELTTETYCRNLINKIRTRQLQEDFPGLSLDGKVPVGTQLTKVYGRIAQHVVSFTPSETAHIISFKTFGRPTAQRPRRRARGAFIHRKAGRAPC